MGAPALRLSVSARRRRDPADGGGQAAALSRRAVPAREPAHPQAHEAPGQRREHAGAHPGVARDLPRHHDPLARSSRAFPARPKREFEELLDFLEEAQLDRVGCFAYSPVEGAAANALPDPVPEEVREERRARFMASAGSGSAPRASRARSARRCACWSTRSKATSPSRARAADAPEIDGVVRVAKAAALRVGDFADVTDHRRRRARPDRAARVTSPQTRGESTGYNRHAVAPPLLRLRMRS